MTTFLIIAKNQIARENHAIQLTTQYKIHLLDIAILETQGSIGIDDVRNLQKQIMLKPMKGDNKAVIIKNAHMITTQAQNALLKTLEEPPNNTYIFLTAETDTLFLPTILSRTSVIHLPEETSFDEKEMDEIKQQIETIFSDAIGAKLKLAEILATDKIIAIAWIEKAMHIARNHMLEHPKTAPRYIAILQAVQQTYTILKTTNVTPRFALENLFLSI